jgi:hypothetical protein
MQPFATALELSVATAIVGGVVVQVVRVGVRVLDEERTGFQITQVAVEIPCRSVVCNPSHVGERVRQSLVEMSVCEIPPV